MTTNVIHVGECREILEGLPAGSVQCCVTSPPYWGLRDYGNNGDGIGLEPTFDEYLERIVAVFREVRRVLRDDGTLWLNMGDSYNGAGLTGGDRAATEHGQLVHRGKLSSGSIDCAGLKPKDLIGQPWRVAFALQADGWYLRSDIIWHKPNPMPESVTDRPTKAHEYVFLMTKSARYFYNADAVREPYLPQSIARKAYLMPAHTSANRDRLQGKPGAAERAAERTMQDANPLGRNRRDVWTISTHAFPEAHFATFPPKLVEPCIMAGTPPQCCGVCGAPWEVVVERTPTGATQKMPDGFATHSGDHGSFHREGRESGATGEPVMASTITGYRPTCDHGDGSGRSIVLDPFMGSGTVALVAKGLSRRYIGIELNPEYAAMAEGRLTQEVLDL